MKSFIFVLFLHQDFNMVLRRCVDEICDKSVCQEKSCMAVSSMMFAWGSKANYLKKMF